MSREPPLSPSCTSISRCQLSTQNDRAEAYAHGAGLTGAVPGQLQQGTLIDHNLSRVELATLVLIAVIILLTYRAIGAPLVVLAGVAVGFPVTVWALGQLDSRFGLAVPQELDPVVIALLLGILTDYTIFFLSGVRARLAKGDDPPEATRITIAEFTPIIVTSAVILSCSLLALLASTLGFFRDLGPALALTVGVALVVSVTLIPALIATFGRLVYWPTTPRLRPGRASHSLRRAWAGACSLVDRSPSPPPFCVSPRWVAPRGSSRRCSSASARSATFPPGPNRESRRLPPHAGFEPGILSPTSVIVQAPKVASQHRDQLEAMQRQSETTGRRGHARPSRPAHARKARGVLRNHC